MSRAMKLASRVFFLLLRTQESELAHSHKKRKRTGKKKTVKKAPTSCEMKRVFSVLLSGCGGLVACFFFLYALRFGSELHGYGKIGLVPSFTATM
jgi:hypothetical protein